MPALDVQTNTDCLHRQYVEEKLTEAEAAAARPDVKWIAHEDFWRTVERTL